MITKSSLKVLFPNAKEIKQFGRKQLFLVVYPDKSFLVSYRTIIGYKTLSSDWILAAKKYSVTTSKHMSYFIKTLSFINYSLVDEQSFNHELFILNSAL